MIIRRSSVLIDSNFETAVNYFLTKPEHSFMSFDEFNGAEFINIVPNLTDSVIKHTYKSHKKSEEYEIKIVDFHKTAVVMHLKTSGMIHNDYRYDFEYKLIEINAHKLELEIIRTLTPLKLFAKLAMIIPGLNDIEDLEKELQFLKKHMEQKQ